MQIVVSSADLIGLQSLCHWWMKDIDVARVADVSFGSTGDHRETQGALDVIDVILSNASAVASLAIAYASWRRAKRVGSSTLITFKVGDVEVTAADASPATIAHIADVLSAAQEKSRDKPAVKDAKKPT
jgi:hypothetical protein